jgi:hypothetical protein
MPHAMRKAIALLVLGLPAAMSFAGFIADPAHGQDASASDRAKVAYPLKASANRRYLVDQENQPFLMVGDSPQALIGRLSVSDAAFYMKNGAGYGINTLWINLLCNGGTACNVDGTSFDGIAPFSRPGDLSTPNPTYLQRADEMIELAAANDMVVILDPAKTAGWLAVLRANGLAKARSYGEFLGRHFEQFPNIIWMHGNDFQTWRNPADSVLVQAVAAGIRKADPIHLHTIELNYLSSSIAVRRLKLLPAGQAALARQRERIWRWVIERPATAPLWAAGALEVSAVVVLSRPIYRCPFTPRAARRLPTLAERAGGTSMSTWSPPAPVRWIETSQRLKPTSSTPRSTVATLSRTLVALAAVALTAVIFAASTSASL